MFTVTRREEKKSIVVLFLTARNKINKKSFFRNILRKKEFIPVQYEYSNVTLLRQQPYRYKQARMTIEQVKLLLSVEIY
jgi:hypothetical protein